MLFIAGLFPATTVTQGNPQMFPVLTAPQTNAVLGEDGSQTLPENILQSGKKWVSAHDPPFPTHLYAFTPESAPPLVKLETVRISPMAWLPINGAVGEHGKEGTDTGFASNQTPMLLSPPFDAFSSPM